MCLIFQFWNFPQRIPQFDETMLILNRKRRKVATKIFPKFSAKKTECWSTCVMHPKIVKIKYTSNNRGCDRAKKQKIEPHFHRFYHFNCPRLSVIFRSLTDFYKHFELKLNFKFETLCPIYHWTQKKERSELEQTVVKYWFSWRFDQLYIILKTNWKSIYWSRSYLWLPNHYIIIDSMRCLMNWVLHELKK